MDRAEALGRVASARSAHLATARPDGRPHVVVVTFALARGNLVTAIDHKPKRTERLQRLVNLESSPWASLLVDHYEDDWTRLWWVRVDGPASIHEEGDLRAEGRAALAAKYPQYAEQPPEGPVIALSVDRVTWWTSTR